ncbi:hypothetical protein NKH87_34400, partial [Mesorhizobium australicum]
MAVVDGDVIELGQRLAGLQGIDGAVGNLEGPADRIAGLIDRRQREGAEIAAGLRREGRGMGVERVDVGEGDGAVLRMRRGVLAGRQVGDLGDRAGLRGRGDGRRVVGAGDGDGHRLDGGAAVA